MSMHQIKRLFRHVIKGSGGHSKSTFECIAQILPSALRQQFLAETPDRRECFETASELLSCPIEELLSKVSTCIGYQPLLRVPPMDSAALAGKVSLEALRRAGGAALTGSGVITAIIAVDPALIRTLFPQFDGLPLFISTWTLIQKALGASESNQSGSEAYSDAETLAREILGWIIFEVRKFGASELTLDFSTNISCYRFSVSGGEVGEGTLDKRAKEMLLKLLPRLSSTHGFNMELPEGDRLLGVTMSQIQNGSKYIINWHQTHQNTLAPKLLKEKDGKLIQFPIVEGETVDFYESSETGPNPSVLIIDDNETFSSVLERFLARKEISSKRASSGEEALNILRENQNSIRLIVCDVHMPGMNGYELLKKLRADEKLRKLAIVMLTSDDDVETEIRLLGSGADAFVSKSEDPRILCVQVQRLLERERDREAA